ncbi:hypothetical protein LCGC14_1881130 [marine sediment metagenome]|uniref:HNH domain-containing protein n=1 Tax=marine sediment metagenome TaxID=412755 RepID=A0A0F9G295_9ZZZZ
MKSKNSKLERAKFWIKHFVETTNPKCYFCRTAMKWEEFYPNISGEQNDNWTEHHINGNHSDNRPKNRTPSHTGCHRSHHRKLEEMAKREEVKKVFGEIEGDNK